jgi:glycosyltransferase involved in cell wall biosynthesis
MRVLRLTLHVLLIPVNDLVSHPITTRFFFLAKKLIEGHNVRISMLRYRNFPTRLNNTFERELGIESVFFRPLSTKGAGSYYLLNSLAMLRAATKHLKRENTDAIIHANLLPSTLGVGIGKTLHLPLLYDYQDHFPDSAAAYFKNTTQRTLMHSVASTLTRINVHYSDVVVTVTNYHRDLIREYEPTKLIEVIPNGVDADVFKPMSKIEALRRLGMEDLSNKTIILFFGSIDPWTDFAAPLQVMKRLANRGIDVLLLIVGFSHVGYYIEDIREMARACGVENRLCFFDPVPQNVLVDFINASDMVIAPYKILPKNQAVPMKLLESLACRKDVIISRIPEVVERFGDVVSTYSSTQELESIILQEIKSQSKVSEKDRSEAVEAIIQNYSWDSLASKYYKLIDLLVSYPDRLSYDACFEGKIHNCCSA